MIWYGDTIISYDMIYKQREIFNASPATCVCVFSIAWHISISSSVSRTQRPADARRHVDSRQLGLLACGCRTLIGTYVLRYVHMAKCAVLCSGRCSTITCVCLHVSSRSCVCLCDLIRKSSFKNKRVRTLYTHIRIVCIKKRLTKHWENIGKNRY